MKTKYIPFVTILLFTVIPNANAKGGFFKELGKAFAGAAFGYVETKAEKHIPEEQRKMFHDINSDVKSHLGIDNTSVSAGRNWSEGKKTNAFLDLSESITSNTGINSVAVQTVLDLARTQNQYKEDIKSGISQEEAINRRNEKLVQCGMNLYDEYMVSDAEKESIMNYEQNKQEKEEKEWERKYNLGIYHELLQRGYSRQEAHMYMNIISNQTGLLRSLSYDNPYDLINNKDSIEFLTNKLITDESVQDSIKEKLDNLNIRDKGIGNGNNSSSNENSFFGTAVTYIPENKKEDNIETRQKTFSQPIIDERANAIKTISKTVLNSYAINDVELSDAQKADLDQIADKMNKFEDLQIDIIGHTCNIGSKKINLNIGERRAIAAKKYLMSKGISENRIQIESRDFSEPIVENDTEEHRKQNRRVTFNVK